MKPPNTNVSIVNMGQELKAAFHAFKKPFNNSEVVMNLVTQNLAGIFKNISSTVKDNK